MRRLLFFLPFLLAGCGDPPAARAPFAVGEVRGQPILSPSKTTNVAAAPATATSGSTPAVATETNIGTAPETSREKVLASAVAGPGSASNVAGSSYPLVGFDKLSGYGIEISDELLGPVTNDLAAIKTKTEALIPDAVKAYSKKRVSLRGFMLPLKVEGGLVTELLIMKDQSMCCYGTVPKIHEWVSVKMTGKGVKPVMDQPVSLQGTLHVGEMRENGYLTGIYQMDGDQLGPEE